jgi:type I restriction enzyme S subunit
MMPWELEHERAMTAGSEVIYQQKLTALTELKQSILQKVFAGGLTSQPDKALEEAVA